MHAHRGTTAEQAAPGTSPHPDNNCTDRICAVTNSGVGCRLAGSRGRTVDFGPCRVSAQGQLPAHPSRIAGGCACGSGAACRNQGGRKDPVLQISGVCALMLIVASDHRGAAKGAGAHCCYTSPYCSDPSQTGGSAFLYPLSPFFSPFMSQTLKTRTLKNCI